MITTRIESTSGLGQSFAVEVAAVSAPHQEALVDIPLGVVGVVIPPTLPLAKRKILIVDDELKGPTRAHVTREAIRALEDVNCDEYQSLLNVSQDVVGFAEARSKGTRGLKAFFGGDGLVNALTSPAFVSSASQELKALVATFIQGTSRANQLRSQIERAFPAEEFDLSYLGSERPSSDDLLNCDLLLLDLVLQPAREPVDEAKKYLERVAGEAKNRPLPPIIMMSNSDDLSLHKSEFSVKSKISAAGLLIIRKHELMTPEFGADGLRLTFRQLEAQRMAAHRMRIFIGTWTMALSKSSEKVEESLWNLDAPAMQQIHNTAFSDNDPYDEHLNELVVREYLWHVESDSAVGDSVREMEAEFLKSFDTENDPPKLKRRFSSHHFDPTYARSLIGHFTWSGWTPSGHFLDADLKDINKLMPFGAILIPGECAADLDCYVHVTQQCDLNAISRNPSANVRSLTFVTVKAVEVFPDKVTHYRPDQLVARGLRIGAHEFDFLLQAGRMMAMPLNLFTTFARDTKLRAQGRLRHDIAFQFLQSTANNMTRPASQRIDRVAAGKAQLSLHGHKFPNRRIILEDLIAFEALPINDVTQGGAEEQTAKFSAKIFDVLIAQQQVVSFPIASCFQIALWIKRSIESSYDGWPIDAEAVCDTLLVGLSTGTDLSLNFAVKVKDVVLARAHKEIDGTNCAREKILLGVFIEKNIGEFALPNMAHPAAVPSLMQAEILGVASEQVETLVTDSSIAHPAQLNDV